MFWVLHDNAAKIAIFHDIFFENQKITIFVSVKAFTIAHGTSQFYSDRQTVFDGRRF